MTGGPERSGIGCAPGPLLAEAVYDRSMVTRLPGSWPDPAEGQQNGENTSPRQLFPLVYRELHLLAERWMRRERAGHTLQATALVHEAYLRLSGWEGEYRDREHFYAVAIRAIRQVLVNHAASRRAMRRGGDRQRVPLREDLALIDEPGLDLLALDELLGQLEQLHERQARVVELRFFGGLSVDEAARILGCSPRTVDADWTVARAWLRARLSRGGA